MFTGLVEAIGTVVSVTDTPNGRGMRFDVPELGQQLGVGDSIAIDGTCLTVTEPSAEGFAVHAVNATLSRTIARHYRPGSRVNLERAMRLSDRLDGHLVQGHVDGVGTLKRLEDTDEQRLLDFELPEDVTGVTIPRGSITINGVSLTVQDTPALGVCRVAIIPHTWENTNLSRLKVGDPVNLEGDLIGKYVGRMLAVRLGEDPH